MKIIGESNGGFILEASKDEVAHLVGYYYAGQSGAPVLTVGRNLNIHGMYDRLYGLANGQGNLNEAARRLQKVIDCLNEVAPLIEQHKPELPA